MARSHRAVGVSLRKKFRGMKSLFSVLLLTALAAWAFSACTQSAAQRNVNYPIYARDLPPVAQQAPDTFPPVSFMPTQDSTVVGVFLQRKEYRDDSGYVASVEDREFMIVYSKAGNFYWAHYEIDLIQDSARQLTIHPSVKALHIDTFGGMPGCYFGSKLENARYKYNDPLATVYDKRTNRWHSYSTGDNSIYDTLTRIPSIATYFERRAAYRARCRRNDTLTVGRWEDYFGALLRLFVNDGRWYLACTTPEKLLYVRRMEHSPHPLGVRLDYERGYVGRATEYLVLRTADTVLLMVGKADDSVFSTPAPLQRPYGYDASRFDSLFYLRGDKDDTFYVR